MEPEPEGFHQQIRHSDAEERRNVAIRDKGQQRAIGSLYTVYDGALPPGYSPVKKQGAIILGSGGDCCKPGGGANLSAGTCYEGAMVSGYPSDATENAVQANIISAGYR
jgi:non-reducing end alpha-L-arabinofuranosidase